MKTSLSMFMVAALCCAVPAGAAERHMMQPIVPADKLAEARALKNPLLNSPEVIAQGKTVYNGKGGCVTCHGIDGDGKGPAAASTGLALLPVGHRLLRLSRHQRQARLRG